MQATGEEGKINGQKSIYLSNASYKIGWGAQGLENSAGTKIKFFFLNFILFLNFTNCISFAKYQNESATGIHVFPILNPPPSSYHPSGLSQCISPKHPVSCIEPGLATRFIYDIIHVSMPFSQIFPPSPSATESIRLFYTSVSLLLSRTQGYC